MTLVVGRRETLVPPVPAAPPAPSVQWRSPARDLWIGTLDESYIGMIERDGDSFLATDGLSESLGRFASARDAQRALVASVDPHDHETGFAPRPAAVVAVIAAISAVATVGAGFASLTL